MARTVTLTTMITRVRRETHQDYDVAVVSAPFVTDAMITDWLNEGIAEIAQYLVTVAPDRMRATTSIAVVVGTEEYTLPSTFQSVRGVDYPIGARYVDVHPYAFQERNDLWRPWSSEADEAPFRYHVFGNGVSGSAARISFRPVPTAAATVLLHYVAVPAALANPGDTFDGIIGLEGYAVAYAEAKVHKRAGEPEGVAVAMAEMQRIKTNIQTEAGRRDRSGLEVVADVRSQGGRRIIFPWS